MEINHNQKKNQQQQINWFDAKRLAVYSAFLLAIANQVSNNDSAMHKQIGVVRNWIDDKRVFSSRPRSIGTVLNNVHFVRVNVVDVFNALTVF